MDVNQRNNLSETPLHLAAASGNYGNGSQLIGLLLEAGAELNSETVWGDTAVHYAAMFGNIECLTYLVECEIKISKTMEKVREGLILCQDYGLSKVRHLKLNFRGCFTL